MPIDEQRARLIAFLCAFVMLTVTVPSALATHNSVGAGVQIAEATEYGPGGDLAADTPESMVPIYHQADFNADEIDKPRFAPFDQRGTHYAAPECTEHGTTNQENQDYEDAVQELGDRFVDEDRDWQNVDERIEPDFCYVGYLDMRHQYVFALNLLAHPQPNDPLYVANPTQDDDVCRGEDAESETGDENVDGLLVRAELAVDHTVNGGECAGEDHESYLPGHDLLVDTTLMETPIGPAADQTVGAEQGAGTLTLPNTLMRYIYLFGQPHPAVEEESGIHAGEGVFGPNPLQGGDPIRDLTGACGDRTQECQLLTPEDIRAYDTNAPPQDDDISRVCTYQPSYFTVNPGTLTSGPCGAMTGTSVEDVGTFVDKETAGGFELGDNPTYLDILPGWHPFTHLLNHESTSWAADVGCDGGSLCHDYMEDEDASREAGAGFFVAVNPVVPDIGGDGGHLWCVRPNILTTEDGAITALRNETPDDLAWPEDRDAILEHEDMTSLYDAHAIDTDVHIHALSPVAHDVRDLTHDDVRSVLGPVQEVAPHRSELANPESFNDPLDVINYGDTKELVKETVGNDDVSEAIERGDFVEASQTSPIWPGQRAFTFDYEAGIGCTSDGFLQDRPADEQEAGGLNFAASFNKVATMSIKDPTALEGTLPAQNEDTSGVAWQADQYTFGGSMVAHLDTSGQGDEGEFAECAQALGEPQPHRNACPWRGIWDAYNEDCNEGDNETIHRTCGEILDSRGYDTTEGVGMFYVLKLSGPILVDQLDQTPPTEPANATENAHVLGDEGQADAQHCIVGTSIGFDGVANETSGLLGVLNETFPGVGHASEDDILDSLCGDEAGMDGERLFLEDAFSDGSHTSGGFSTDWFFTKAAPTPAALGLGEDDTLCMNVVFNVDEDRDEPTADTDQTLRLDGSHHFQHEIPLGSLSDWSEDDRAGVTQCGVFSS